jgi:hypothetical protein
MGGGKERKTIGGPVTADQARDREKELKQKYCKKYLFTQTL